MSSLSTEVRIESPDQARSQFPALNRIHNGYPVAYFDGPGGTQVPRIVVDAMADYLYHHNANTHWAYPTSKETDAAIEDARSACADLLNAASNEIAFGANMTTLTFHLSRALGAQFQPGDEIVVTELDHHANVAPWRRLERERQLIVRSVPLVPETGQLDWEAFEQAVTKKTRLVAVGAAANALGTVNDITRATALARNVNALMFVDGVHSVPHTLPDVRALDCDFFAFSSYKAYGPHIGVMFGKHEHLAQVDFPKLIPAPDYPPENAETGTQNQEGMVGAAAAVDFMAAMGSGNTRRERLNDSYARFHERSMAQTKQLWNGLASLRHVTLYGPTPDQPRTPTVAFTVANVKSTDVAKHLATKGVFVSHGDFYAATVIERLGLGDEGLVRAGCACYTTEEEVDRLVEAVADI
jgi:cysteine desulfurase family protein (TIGR01976 family)